MPRAQRGTVEKLGRGKWGLRYRDGQGGRHRISPFPTETRRIGALPDRDRAPVARRRTRLPRPDPLSFRAEAARCRSGSSREDPLDAVGRARVRRSAALLGNDDEGVELDCRVVEVEDR
jgi:hypothetical protein